MNRSIVLQRATRERRPRIPRRPPGEPVPLSFGQEQIWLHAELAPDIPLYTESLTIHRHGTLDREAFVASFREILERHEIWRTTFEWSQGRVVQRVQTDGEPCIRVADLRHVPKGEREAAALEVAAEDLRVPFDLSREPGVRARLVTLADTDHRLYLCLHHMVFDGISIYRVFLPELAALYEAKVKGTPCVLEEPRLQYADFAHWQRHSFREAELAPLVGYWRQQLAGASATIDLPADYPRPHRQSFRGGLLRFELPGDVTAAARSTALQEGCTLFMVLLAGFVATLHRWSSQTDMVIGSVSGGRDQPELERLIGYFLRMLLIRTDLRGDPTFREILRRIREALLEALCHDAIPFQRLVRAVTDDRDLSRSPLFQVTFSIEPPMPPLGPEWDLSEMDAGTTVSKFDLSIELEDRGAVIAGRAIYSEDLFQPATIAGLLADYRSLLGRAASDPGLRLSVLGGSCRGHATPRRSSEAPTKRPSGNVASQRT